MSEEGVIVYMHPSPYGVWEKQDVIRCVKTLRMNYGEKAKKVVNDLMKLTNITEEELK